MPCTSRPEPAIHLLEADVASEVDGDVERDAERHAWRIPEPACASEARVHLVGEALRRGIEASWRVQYGIRRGRRSPPAQIVAPVKELIQPTKWIDERERDLRTP